MRRLALLLAVLLVVAAPASALPVSQRGEAFNRLEKKTMCIECNVPLNIAVAAQADATRTQIRRLLDRGLSEPQVLDALVADYGDNILASPEPEGFNLLAYLVPVAALALLLALGLVLLPRWKRSRGDDQDEDGGSPTGGDGPRGGGPSPTHAENERLDAELARYGA